MLMKFVCLTALLGCSLMLITATAELEWNQVENCHNYIYRTTGFALKARRGDGVGDDTALKGISLKCGDDSWIYSGQEPSGEWGENFICPNNGFLFRCQLRVEPKNGITVVNNLKCFCLLRNGKVEELEGDGLNQGSWEEMYTLDQFCRNGIIGLQTQVLKNTALTNISFTCSKSDGWGWVGRR
ncbi:vitelline membrane outer layer protein 1 homolog [Daphnia pulex]|uniref:vitelline membrane outer layer protein 1 homolog n=1 Tax=Daphnia pulex TaxID=6669 RepID=UPI001EE0606C|nr:vitelline membrane outer layer protein 1 homolog [Daphnia pulex]